MNATQLDTRAALKKAGGNTGTTFEMLHRHALQELESAVSHFPTHPAAFSPGDLDRTRLCLKFWRDQCNYNPTAYSIFHEEWLEFNEAVLMGDFAAAYAELVQCQAMIYKTLLHLREYCNQNKPAARAQPKPNKEQDGSEGLKSSDLLYLVTTAKNLCPQWMDPAHHAQYMDVRRQLIAAFKRGLEKQEGGQL
jgi:hypothetical protein